MLAVLQQNDGQWVAGKILEGISSENKEMYQEMLSKWKSTAFDQDLMHQLEVCVTLHSSFCDWMHD